MQNESVRAEMATEQARESRIDEEVSALVDTFNSLMKERRFQEAEVIAKQVQELKPEDPIAISMFHNSRMGTRLMMDEEVRDAEGTWIHRQLDRCGSLGDRINPEPADVAARCTGLGGIFHADVCDGCNDGDSRLSAAEQEIQKKLTTEVNVKYTNRPLGEVLNDCRR